MGSWSGMSSPRLDPAGPSYLAKLGIEADIAECLDSQCQGFHRMLNCSLADDENNPAATESGGAESSALGSACVGSPQLSCAEMCDFMHFASEKYSH